MTEDERIMKRLRYGVLAILAACALTAGDCDGGGQPQQTTAASTNPTYQVDLLFIHEGVKVYRFVDDGRYRYYAVPNTGAPAEVSAEWSESCGKNCSKVVTEQFSTMKAVAVNPADLQFHASPK